MIFVAHLLFYLSLPLMIHPTCIKEPVILQICFQIPSLLPLKTLLLILPPLMTFHNYLSYFLIILTLHIPWKKTSFVVAGWKEDTALVKMIKKYTTKIRGSIAPRDLIKTRNFITFIGFSWFIHIRVLASWNINIVWNKYSDGWCVFHLLSFKLPVELAFVLVFFLFNFSLTVPISISALLETLTLCLFTFWMHVMISLSDN